MNDQCIQQIIEEYITAYNNFDVAGMLIKLHPKIVFRNVNHGEVNLLTTYFSHRKQTITRIEIDVDQAEVWLDYHAILAVDLPNGLKKGEPLILQGQSSYYFENGLIILIEDKS